MPAGLSSDHIVGPVTGKRDSIHHHLLEVTFEITTVLELRQKLLHTTPSGWWWWCIESVFRVSERVCVYTYIYIYIHSFITARGDALEQRRAQGGDQLQRRALSRPRRYIYIYIYIYI